MNLDISKRFARISRPIGLPMWPKPRSNYFRRSKHVAALEMLNCSRTVLANLPVSVPLRLSHLYFLAQSSLLMLRPLHHRLLRPQLNFRSQVHL